MAWFARCFTELADPRTGNARRHKLLDILTIALTATICGAESCVDFADFARDRRALFEEFLELPGGLPSHDTFSRLFRLLDPTTFASCFARFLEHLGEIGPGVIAIDGKTLRRSFDNATGRSALHVVTAFATDRRLVLAQVATPPGANEKLAAREVLRLLDLNGMLVTADAMHCNAQTAALVDQKGGQWLFSLKANCPSMLAGVVEYFDDPHIKLAEHVTVDNDHGRLETRRHRVSHEVDWLIPGRSESDELRMPGLATIGRIEASVEHNGQTTTCRRYYLSSARLSPQCLAEAVRAHWRIEATHWILDTDFREDLARNRADHAPENLAILRKLALNVLRSARPDISVRRKRKRAGWSDEFARSIIGQMR
jgi:predicted transposase YbfD/YdcC